MHTFSINHLPGIIKVELKLVLCTLQVDNKKELFLKTGETEC